MSDDILEDLSELSGQEIMDRFTENEQFSSFESEHGIEQLNKIAKALGYKEEGFKYGSSLEQFLRDNPACQQLIVDWITEWLNKDKNWKEALYVEPAEDEVIEKEYSKDPELTT